MAQCRKPSGSKLFSALSLPQEEQTNRFVSLVCQWYWNFGQGKHITMAELKVVGNEVAARLQIPLPQKWLAIVRKRHGVQLHPYRKHYYSKPIQINGPNPKRISGKSWPKKQLAGKLCYEGDASNEHESIQVSTAGVISEVREKFPQSENWLEACQVMDSGVTLLTQGMFQTSETAITIE